MTNLRHWDALGKTDPKHTKPFTRAGGFKGTATKPIWIEYRLTEHFGPCGIGWGYQEPAFTLVPAGEEILVFCTVSAWYRDGENQSAPIYGVGGDKVLVKRQSGVIADDEAYKKAFTDALGNAFKHIGSGADVHMGLFDDSKYVNEMRREFAEEPVSKADTMEPAVPIGTVVEDPFAPELPKAAPKSRVDHPRRMEALDAYARIKKAIDAQHTLGEIEALIAANTKNGDLGLIKEVHGESYDLLMNIAQARKNELRAAA